MHAVSALSIKRVAIDSNSSTPIHIEVFMEDFAGLFQVEAVLRPKILSSGLQEYIEVYANVNGKIHRVFPV